MAGEVGHVVYGARLLTVLGDAVEEPSYWAGTLFPDIRHLGVVSRHRTHPADVTLQSMPGKNDFHTGMRVHAWVDATREKYLRESNMKEMLPWHPFVPHCLKLYEDELLYDKFDDWDVVGQALARVYDDELFYIDARERVQHWHEMLRDYLGQRPDADSRRRLSLAIGLSEQSAAEVASVIERLRGDARTEQLIQGFLAHLEQTLT